MLNIKEMNKKFVRLVKNVIFAESAMFLLLLIPARNLGCYWPNCIAVNANIGGFTVLSVYLVLMLLLNIIFISMWRGNINKARLLIYNNIVFVVLFVVGCLAIFT